MQIPINCECSANFNSWDRVCLPWQDCQSAASRSRVRNLENIVNLSNDKYLCKNCCFNDQPIVWWVSCPRLSTSQPALPTFNDTMCEYHHSHQVPQKPYKRTTATTTGLCNHNSRSITNLASANVNATTTNYLNYNQCNCGAQHPAAPPPPLQSILGHSNNGGRSVHCCVHTNGGGLENDTSGSGECFTFCYCMILCCWLVGGVIMWLLEDIINIIL